jgi:hypothetical protein
MTGLDLSGINASGVTRCSALETDVGAAVETTLPIRTRTYAQHSCADIPARYGRPDSSVGPCTCASVAMPWDVLSSAAQSSDALGFPTAGVQSEGTPVDIVGGLHIKRKME